MEDSFSSSNCTDKEDCISKSQSNLSLSVGYFPYEDGIAWKDINTPEDRTSEGSSCHFLLPVQESWATESGRMPRGRQDTPEKLCELPITQVLDAYLGSEHEDSLATLDLNGGNQKMDKFLQERTNQALWELDDLMKNLKALLDHQKDDNDPAISESPLDEDLQLSSTISPHMYQVSNQKHKACHQALPNCGPPEIEDVSQFLEISPWLEEDELAEMISQVTGTAETSSPPQQRPPCSARQPKEGDTHTHSETTSCLNMGSIFHWLRKWFFSSLRGRKHPERANKSPDDQESQKSHFLGSKRIQPQESLESEHPMYPDF